MKMRTEAIKQLEAEIEQLEARCKPAWDSVEETGKAYEKARALWYPIYRAQNEAEVKLSIMMSMAKEDES